MINLFYESSYWGHTNGMNGPKKVVHNLIASLEQEGISYAVNVEEHKNNFLIQYDWTGHVKHSNLSLENCVIGPQIWMFDGHVNELKENPHYYKSIIAPSQWVKDLYVDKFGYPEEKISVWPVGIDISEQLEKNIEFDCLVYYKRRSDQELRTVTEFLERKNLSYKLVSYGGYTDGDLQKFATQCKFCFLLNGTESQGIAVQEIMATGTPLFVWDVTHWNDQGDQWKVPATSVPFWSNECGERVFDSNFDETFDQFYSKLDEYNPRKYVEENLSYKQSVKTLMEIFDAA